MVKDFLLGGFSTKKDEYLQYLTRISDSVNGLLDTIETLEEYDTKQDAHEVNSKLQNLSWLVDRFPKHHFDDLHASYYIRRSELFADIKKSTLQVLEDIENSVKKNLHPEDTSTKLPEKNILLDVSEKLAVLTGRVQKFYFRIRLTTQILFLVPVVLSFLLGLHYRFSDGFINLSSDINWPNDAYARDEWDNNKFVYSDEYKTKFWNEFSRFFFAKSNNFKDVYFSEDEIQLYINAMNGDWNEKIFQKNIDSSLTNSFHTKLVFKNNNNVKPLLIYKMSASAELSNPQPFPWENLLVTPELDLYYGFVDNEADDDINTAHPLIHFASYDGIGPVIDLQWQANLENVKLTLKDSLNTLHNDTRDFNLNRFHTIETYGDSLDGELFLEGSAPPNPDTKNLTEFETDYGETWYEYNDKFFKYHSVWYEVIYTKHRLSEITEISRQLELRYQYHSLKGEAFNDSVFIVLQDSIYYMDKKELLISDPREPIPLPTAVESLYPAFWGFVAKVIGEPDYLREPKGVDLLIDTLEIDMGFKNKKSFTHDIDVIINPAGYVVAYIFLNDLNNGIYTLNFQINEDPIATTQFEYLKPDDFKFDYSDVKWLKEKLGYYRNVNR